MYGSRLEEMEHDFIVVFQRPNSVSPDMPLIVKGLELAGNTNVGISAKVGLVPGLESHLRYLHSR